MERENARHSRVKHKENQKQKENSDKDIIYTSGIKKNTKHVRLVQLNNDSIYILRTTRV